jgi:hypothetical protein
MLMIFTGDPADSAPLQLKHCRNASTVLKPEVNYPYWVTFPGTLNKLTLSTGAAIPGRGNQKVNYVSQQK